MRRRRNWEISSAKLGIVTEGFTRSILVTAALVTALIAAAGCGGTSGSPITSGGGVARESHELEKGERHPRAKLVRRKLHGKAELLTPDTRKLGVAILGPGGSAVTRTLRLHLEGLRPTGRSIYAVWLSATPKQMLMLGSFSVGRGGNLQSEAEFPSILTRNLEHGAFLELVLTRANRARLEAALRRLPSRNAYSPYTGRVIARGLVLGPIVGARPNISSITR